jgi:flavorubredoxin
MAEAVAEGARSAQGRIDAELTHYVSAETLSGHNAILVGVSTYHHDMAIGMKKLFGEAAEENLNLQGKAAAAFGSYRWSGEAPKLVVGIMEKKFMLNVVEPPLLARCEPDQGTLEECRGLEKRVAESLIHAT